jgi:hypothetical protein
MLVLKRKEGQWVEIVHHSGDVLRLRVYGICAGLPGRVNIAFEDPPRHFEIRRPERTAPTPATLATADDFIVTDFTPLDTTMPVAPAE